MADGEPGVGAVAEAAAAHVERPIGAVTAFEEGVNAVYRVTVDGGPDVVLKAGTATPGSALLSGPVLIDRLREETDLPVPTVVAVVPEGDDHVDHAYVLTTYVEGRREPDLNEFSNAAQERLVREAGRHLAAIHELPHEGQFGRLHASAGTLFVRDGTDTWPEYVSGLVDYATDALDGRFGDLAAPVEDAMASFAPDERRVDRSILYGDYHPKNLVFDPDERADTLVRALLDFNYRLVGDAPYDLAIAELNLVELPAGGTERADGLRRAFREAYASARGGTRADYFDDRYPYYRLLAVPGHLKHVEYFRQFGWEADPEATVRRLRQYVRDRCAAIQARS